MPPSASSPARGATGSTTRREAARARANSASPGADSGNRIDMPMPATPAALRRSTRAACTERFHGQRPSAESVASSIATTTEVGARASARNIGSTLS